MNRNLVFGAGLAAALMLVVLAATGGRTEAPKPAAPTVPAEQPLNATINFLAEPPAPQAAKPEAEAAPATQETPKPEATAPAKR